MRNPIKDAVTAHEKYIRFWFGDNIGMFMGVTNFEGTYVVHEESYTEEEISNMKKYVKDNLKELPTMCTYKTIKIGGKVVFNR